MSESAAVYTAQPSPTALAVARAREELEAAKAVLADADRKEATIKARLAVLTETRNAITDRRETGDERDDDPDRFALLTADADRLTELLPPARDAARHAAGTVQTAAHRLAEANQHQKQHIAEAQAAALEARLHELEALMMRGITELARLKREAAGPERGRMLTASEIFRPGAALQKLAQFGVIP